MAPASESAVEMETPPPVLELRNVEIGYGPLAEVVRGVSLTVRIGQIVALLGPNGAGKTTILRGITGLLEYHNGKIRGGEIRFDDENITGASAARVVSAGATVSPEGRQVFPSLTVEENLLTGAHTQRKDAAGVRRSLGEVYELFPPLEALSERRAGYLSGGEQQMLAVGRALMGKPRLLILDEPSLGLAPLIIEKILAALIEVNARGTAILLVEQNAFAALSMAHHGYVLEGGRIVLEGSAQHLLANDDIQEFYLGLDPGGERKGYREVKHYRRRKRWTT